MKIDRENALFLTSDQMAQAVEYAREQLAIREKICGAPNINHFSGACELTEGEASNLIHTEDLTVGESLVGLHLPDFAS